MRYEFTVIGAVVNLAARLEGLAHADRVLAEASLEPWIPPELQVVGTDAVQIKGRSSPVSVLHLDLAQPAER